MILAGSPLIANHRLMPARDIHDRKPCVRTVFEKRWISRSSGPRSVRASSIGSTLRASCNPRHPAIPHMFDCSRCRDVAYDPDRFDSAGVREKDDSDSCEARMRTAIENALPMIAARAANETPEPAVFLETQTARARSRWVRFFIDYDPRPARGETTCLILATNGENDRRVTSSENPLRPKARLAARAISGQQSERFRVWINSFRANKSGRLSAYAENSETGSSAMLELVGSSVTS